MQDLLTTGAKCHYVDGTLPADPTNCPCLQSNSQRDELFFSFSFTNERCVHFDVAVASPDRIEVDCEMEIIGTV